MKLSLLFVGLTCTFCAYGQMYGQKKGFDFQEACFKNPSLPYCELRDFVIKPPKGGPVSKNGTPLSAVGQTMPVTVDATGIDWRFADPSADALAVLNGSKLPASRVGHSVIDQLASSQNLSANQAQNVFRALSGVSQVALSISADSTLILVTGRPADAVLPSPDAGWKSLTVGDKQLLIGRTAAVDQAAQRLLSHNPLADLPQAATQRNAGSDFWVAGSAKLAGRDAVSAGVKQFELSASLGDSLTSDTVFQFATAPDPNAIHAWLNTLGDTKLDGSAVAARMSLNADETAKNLTQIATSPLGLSLASFLQTARYLPVRDTAATVHNKPVIYGLDDGPREVK